MSFFRSGIFLFFLGLVEVTSEHQSRLQLKEALLVGFFLGGQQSGLILNPGGSAGNLCLDGTIIRFINQIGNAGPDGTFTESIDVLNIPNPHSGPILAGQTWYFQAWHRDGLQSNFTNTICVPFN